MKADFFKARKLFDFFPHPYDIGNLFGPWRRNADSHFLLKLYKLDAEEYPDYYVHHLSHTLENNIAPEKEFYRQLWDLLENRIGHFKNKNPHSSNHDRDLDRIEKLKQFQKFLLGIDRWNARPAPLVIEEKDKVIQQYINEIEKLKQQIIILTQYEVKQKISIEDEHLPTLMDLFQQMRNLRLPSGRLLLRCDHKITYAKMIAKYFSHGEKHIPVETARNYFVEKEGDIPSKGTVIYPDRQLFKIIDVK
ncbi:hypothetical protein QFZ20_003076 [Flavobacterium sp. W4I14]|jgi:hypothetical protein|nr:hypothetical protein [Flavobacterium sp. W4I14]